MSGDLMTRAESASKVVAHAFSGALGSPQNKGVGYSLIAETPTSFTWSVALTDYSKDNVPLDRYEIKVDRRSKEISPAKLIVIPTDELAAAIFDATGHHLHSSSRFSDGALSISYKATVRERQDLAYVIQLRHHGRVASMDSFMTLVSKTVNPQFLPLPPVFPIPGEKQRQEITGMGRQITQFVPGVMASSVYPQLPHTDKLVIVRKMALAYQACWELPLPTPQLIGELLAADVNGQIVLEYGPDRHHSLGGPFSSVKDYLRAYIRSSFAALERQQGIEEYKQTYLERIKNFVEAGMHNIPSTVEDIPVVAIHGDMGLHNVIVSSETFTDIQAVIDWEFLSCAPYASLYGMIERLFRRPAEGNFGPEYDQADELREAFWGSIPTWKFWYQSDSTSTFLEWFRFGILLNPPYRSKDLKGAERAEFWQENIRAVEHILQKYS